MYEYTQIISETGHEFSIMNLGTSKYENNPTYYNVMIKIKSGLFQGEHSFSFYKENVQSMIKILNTMHSELKGILIIRDDESDSHVNLEMGNYGHMQIHGEIGGTHTGNYLCFDYESDHTVLPGLIMFFESLLKASK